MNGWALLGLAVSGELVATMALRCLGRSRPMGVRAGIATVIGGTTLINLGANTGG